MPRSNIGLQVTGLEDMLQALEQTQRGTKGAVEAALKATKQVVNQELTKDTINANYPALGKYASGKLKRSIDRNFNVKWEGTVANMDIGYDFSISGMSSIFILRGTPKHAPVQKIYDDIYGNRIKRKFAKAQKEAIEKIIDRG